MIPGQAIRITSSAIVLGVLPEIEIWRAAVLMLSRYAGDAEANSFSTCRGASPEVRVSALCAEASSGRRSRWGGYLGSGYCRD
jgi:hypothetical protein